MHTRETAPSVTGFVRGKSDRDVARQIAELNRWAEQNGQTFRTIIVNDIDLLAGELIDGDTLAVWDLDRISRKASDLERLLEVDCTIVTVCDGRTIQTADRMPLRLMAAMAALELKSDARSRRAKAAAETRRANQRAGLLSTHAVGNES